MRISKPKLSDGRQFVQYIFLVHISIFCTRAYMRVGVGSLYFVTYSGVNAKQKKLKLF